MIDKSAIEKVEQMAVRGAAAQLVRIPRTDTVIVFGPDGTRTDHVTRRPPRRLACKSVDSLVSYAASVRAKRIYVEPRRAVVIDEENRDDEIQLDLGLSTRLNVALSGRESDPRTIAIVLREALEAPEDVVQRVSHIIFEKNEKDEIRIGSGRESIAGSRDARVTSELPPSRLVLTGVQAYNVLGLEHITVDVEILIEVKPTEKSVRLSCRPAEQERVAREILEAAGDAIDRATALDGAEILLASVAQEDEAPVNNPFDPWAVRKPS